MMSSMEMADDGTESTPTYINSNTTRVVRMTVQATFSIEFD